MSALTHRMAVSLCAGLTDIDQSFPTLLDSLLMFPRLFAICLEVPQLILFVLEKVDLLVLCLGERVL